MNARWEVLVRSLATDNGWAHAWLWVGYPVPALWARPPAPEPQPPAPTNRSGEQASR